jgi:hypothetical protein
LILLPLVSQVVVFRGPIQEKETPDAETLYLPIARPIRNQSITSPAKNSPLLHQFWNNNASTVFPSLHVLLTNNRPVS